MIITTLHIRKLRHKLNSGDYPMVTYLQLGEAKTIPKALSSTPTGSNHNVASFLMLRVAPKFSVRFLWSNTVWVENSFRKHIVHLLWCLGIWDSGVKGKGSHFNRCFLDLIIEYPCLRTNISWNVSGQTVIMGKTIKLLYLVFWGVVSIFFHPSHLDFLGLLDGAVFCS